MPDRRFTGVVEKFGGRKGDVGESSSSNTYLGLCFRKLDAIRSSTHGVRTVVTESKPTNPPGGWNRRPDLVANLKRLQIHYTDSLDYLLRSEGGPQ